MLNYMSIIKIKEIKDWILQASVWILSKSGKKKKSLDQRGWEYENVFLTRAGLRVYEGPQAPCGRRVFV